MSKIFVLIAFLFFLTSTKVVKITDFDKKDSSLIQKDNIQVTQRYKEDEKDTSKGKNQKGWQKKKNQIQQALERGQDVNGINSVGRFKGWMKKYLKSYGPEEGDLRLSYFLSNLKQIEDHNTKKSSYKMDINKFADLSDDQFKRLYLMENAPRMTKIQQAPQVPQISQGQNAQNNRLLQELTYIDWRTKVKFGEIKSQGKCAACYAFANIGVIEIHRSIRYRYSPAPILSQQQIIDCCKVMGYQCDGCTNGQMGKTFQFLADKGISSLKQYPYVGTVDICKLSGIKTTKYINTRKPYYQMYGQRSAVTYLSKGPLAVAADGRTWKFYSSGIHDGCQTESLNLTHAVVVIGMQMSEYWMIRNSWGNDWGMEGYINISWSKNCGILEYIFFPLLL